MTAPLDFVRVIYIGTDLAMIYLTAAYLVNPVY